MKTFFLLPLFLCFFGITNLCAQSSILVKDTAGQERRLVFGKEKVLLVFTDANRAPVLSKLVAFESGNFFLKNGEVFSTDLIKEIRIPGPKEKAIKPLAIYYFCSINASLGIMFWVADYGLFTIFVDALVILITPITMAVVPAKVAKKARRENPITIPMKGNFR